MSRVNKYYCEVCGTERCASRNWFIAEIAPTGLLISPWRDIRAQHSSALHLCGEAHVQVFVSRYLASPASFAGKVPILDTAEKDLTTVQSHLVTRVMEQPNEVHSETDESYDILAAAEAAIKGKVTIGSFNSDHFDA
jgi:hypothetical protein